MAGQIAGLIKKEATCKEIITSIYNEGVALLNRGINQ